MIRALINGYLVIVVAAGPAICCCSFGKAFVHAPTQSEPAEQSCCCKHATPCDDAEAPRPRPAPAKCPCRESTTCARFMPAIVQPSERIVVDWLTLLATALPAFDSDPTDLVVSQTNVPSGVASHRPFWDPDDLLDLHHRLRC